MVCQLTLPSQTQLSLFSAIIQMLASLSQKGCLFQASQSHPKTGSKTPVPRPLFEKFF